MPRRYSFESDAGEREREPLDHNRYYQGPAPQAAATMSQQPPHSGRYQQQAPRYQDEDQDYGYSQQSHYAAQDQNYPRSSPPRAAAGAHRPGGAHPDSHFQQRQATDRRYPPSSSAAAVAATSAAGPFADPVVSPVSPPLPPAHRDFHDPSRGRPPAAYPQRHDTRSDNLITPGADNFGVAAAGGLSGIAMSVADQNARTSGVEAMRQTQQGGRPGYPPQAYQGQFQDRSLGHDDPYNQPQQGLRAGPHGYDQESNSSVSGRGGGALLPGHGSPATRSPSRSPHSRAHDIYSDDPYQGYSRDPNPGLGMVNPVDIEDDGDDGLNYGRSRNARNSMLSLGGQSNRSGKGAPLAAAGAAGGVMGTIGGLVGRNGQRDSGAGYYDPVRTGNVTAPNDNNSSTYDLGGSAQRGAAGTYGEKSEWLASQKKHSKKWRWAIIVAIGVVVAAGIVVGLVFGVVLKRNGPGGGGGGGGQSGQSASADTAANGDLGKDSSEIQALLNNKNLHKVFPGVDYTPLNTQYPECLHYPPSQNNVTRDMAILTQLSDTIRLYGTDCNQTQMVIHAIERLGVTDRVKVWLGVWQDNNVTTNARQLAQMWDIIDEYHPKPWKPFKGLIVANEILFREQMTAWELGQLLGKVRTNLTARGITDLPVATSDLGTKWDKNLADVSDYIMANIHPFFSGVNAKDSSAWSMDFWNKQTGSFFKSDPKKNVIAEIGWPSQGGTNCGKEGVTNCPGASEAGIPQLNNLMQDFVCAALNNGTQYFWFEAFDEPWKVRFNTPSQNWEDHWGLLDVNRNLKPGVKIPDCGGKTV